MGPNYAVQARHLSTQLKLKLIAARIEQAPALESTRELSFRLAPNSYVFIYNYGTVVFFNVSEGQRQKFIQTVMGSADPTTASFKNSIFDDFTVEDVDNDLTVTHEMGFNKLRIKDLTDAKIRFICGVIGESVALDYFEQTVEDLLLQSQKISKALKETGHPRMSMKDMAKYVGTCLNTKQEIIADLYVIDSPDETWDDQVLSRLYEDLKNLFEIETRYKVLEYKLKLIQETVDVILEMLRFQKQTAMEITIIVLIGIEVGWFVARIFFPQLGGT